MVAAVMIHPQVPGLGRQAPGSGIQHQVQVQACLDVSHLCTFARGHAAFAPLHIVSRTRTRTRTRTRRPVSDTRSAET